MQFKFTRGTGKALLNKRGIPIDKLIHNPRKIAAREFFC